MLLGPGLFSVNQGVHRKQRKMLNPVFAAEHLRKMTPVFYTVARNVRVSRTLRLPLDALRAGVQLVTAISSRVDGGAKPVDVLTWMSRTALELIGQSGIGYSFDPLVEDVADEYTDAVKNFLYVLLAHLFLP